MNDARQVGVVAPDYLLGHSAGEIKRLQKQAQLIDPITERFFREAGLAPGMRVLDVGSGAGDVAFLAAQIVGRQGEVVGVDRVPEAIQAATARARDRDMHNVLFRHGDPCAMAFERPFDAVIGRYVLQFQKDPASMLRQLAARLRPGGIAVFHEIDWGGLGSQPPLPTYEQCRRWGLETLRLHGTETQMGRKLHSTFIDAGLAPPALRLEALIRGGASSLELLELVSGLIATLLPEMTRLGVASAAEVGLDTLLARLTSEAMASRGVLIGHYQIAAWSRVHQG